MTLPPIWGIDEGGDEYVFQGALRLINEPKPKLTDEEIINSLGCLSMCFGPRKKILKYTKGKTKDCDKMNLRQLVNEAEKQQLDQRDEDLKKYGNGLSFNSHIFSKWNRKVRLLNSTKHLVIKDQIGLREIAAYLGKTIKEEDQIQIDNSHLDYRDEKPNIFQNVDTITLGFKLLSSTKIELPKPIYFGELAGISDQPNHKKSLSRIITKLKPKFVYAEWKPTIPLDLTMMFWLKNLAMMCRIWEVEGFTWILISEAPPSSRKTIFGQHVNTITIDKKFDGNLESHIVSQLTGLLSDIRNLKVKIQD
ncbi:uncharacterized protein L201_001511 [Kwoniella dendrophila CBS 6074]|uniref:Uncharacterized protein n=1 Tax=Kwoniella dendrophila CBS 6074 TaxID=1295534 RepID=A0AAX4JPG8_9TREE